TDQLQQYLTHSQGGVAQTLTEAMNRFAHEQQRGGTVMDGYQWTIAPASPSPTLATATTPPWEPIAARQAIRWLSRQRDVTQVEELDRLHAIAKAAEIVTPYSSMLVLVNERQRAALAAAESNVDRFARTVENGEDVLTNPGSPLTASVPEPGMPFALLGVGVIFLWRMVRDRRPARG
ncbi:MAG TPA: hypothetical protein V6D02_01775, partial [Candidatus Obscuribacterales bacterium]